MPELPEPPEELPEDPPDELVDPASCVRPPELLPPPLELPLQKMPNRHPPLLDPVRPPEELPLDPVRPPEELPVRPPLDPVHDPALQVCPLNVQSLQVTPPVPQALSEADVSQLPLRSQQPLQLLGSHAPGAEESSPAVTPPPVLLEPPELPDAYEVPESSPPLLVPLDPLEDPCMFEPPEALGVPKLA